MGEISAASSEQSVSVSQVGEAIVQTGQPTQQDAARVDKMAAAASSLNAQADQMVNTVAVFVLSGGAGVQSARTTVEPAARLAAGALLRSAVSQVGSKQKAMALPRAQQAPGFITKSIVQEWSTN